MNLNASTRTRKRWNCFWQSVSSGSSTKANTFSVTMKCTPELAAQHCLPTSKSSSCNITQLILQTNKWRLQDRPLPIHCPLSNSWTAESNSGLFSLETHAFPTKGCIAGLWQGGFTQAANPFFCKRKKQNKKNSGYRFSAKLSNVFKNREF